MSIKQIIAAPILFLMWVAYTLRDAAHYLRSNEPTRY
jgi:hypothetical protein